MCKDSGSGTYLEEELERVKQRIELLNQIEEKLIRMRELAQTVVDHDLTQKEIKAISQEVKSLEEQVKRLNIEKQWCEEPNVSSILN